MRMGGTVAAAASRGTQRALQVVCGSGGKGSGPGLTADQQRRAVGILSAARNLDFRRLGNQLGGTLVVDDASHKQDVQQVSGTNCEMGLRHVF